jgi:hydroxymethylglutaryl-CoA synthase
MNEVGISDIAFFLPCNCIGIRTIAEHRCTENPELSVHLERAMNTTGQRSLRFPCAREDAATMGAEAALRLLEANPRLPLSSLRFLTVGTETGLDHSKPASAYVQGMLRQAGLALPGSLSSFQVQHACAGGTLALLSVGALLLRGADEGEAGIVICSDIARYESNTTAEITQGAGAAALLVERSPKLLELDLATAGFHSSDVDDFFRPLGSETARVKGAYSVKCYSEGFEEAFLDHCRRRGEQPADVLDSTDFFVLHTPFRNLPEMVMLRLLSRMLGTTAESGREFLRRRGFEASLAAVAEVGNTYTGSLYLCLAATLADRYRELGSRIVGRSVLLASYGSGSTTAVISARVAAGAPQVIAGWNFEGLLAGGRAATWERYAQWMRTNGHGPDSLTGTESTGSHPGRYYLRNLRADGYREYGFRPTVQTTEPVRFSEEPQPVSAAGSGR